MKNYDVKQVGTACFGVIIGAYLVNLIMSFFYIDAFNITNVILNLIAPVCLLVYAAMFAKRNQKLLFEIGTGIYILQNLIAFFYSMIANIKTLVNHFEFGILLSMLIAMCAAAYTVACLVFAFLIALKGSKRPNTKSIMFLLFIILGVLNTINAISSLTGAISGCFNGVEAGKCAINIISALMNLFSVVAMTIGYITFNNHIITKYNQARANAKKAQESKKSEPVKKAEPAKKAEPVKKTESVKKAEPVKKATTTKKATTSSTKKPATSTATKKSTTVAKKPVAKKDVEKK